MLRDVPLATLAAILIFVAAHIFGWVDLTAIARFDRFEFALAAVTLLAVVFIGVEQGIAIAVGLAILDHVRLSSRPQLHVLGRVPGTTSWTPLSGGVEAEQLPGVLVVLFATPLWYANAVHFREEVGAAIGAAGGSTRVLVLDTVGMTDIDFTGSRSLGRVLNACERDRITVGIARAGEHLRGKLQRSGLASRVGEDRFYSTVDEAVSALAPPAPSVPPAPPPPPIPPAPSAPPS